jgi:hypothetical protein
MALLMWLLGIGASVLSIAYIVILAFLLAAKRRMETPAVTRTSAVARSSAATRMSRPLPEMRYRNSLTS